MVTAPKRFFFFGTLLDPDIRRLVLGINAPEPDLVPAELTGYRAMLARGRQFPVLMKSAAGHVRGAVTSPLGLEAIERLMLYEGSEYRLAELPVTLAAGDRVKAALFLVERGLLPSTVSWDLARWQRMAKPRTLKRIVGWMAEYRPSPSVLAERRRNNRNG